TFIQDYSIQLKKGSTHELTGWVRFNGPVSRQEVTIRIPEASVEYKTLTDEGGYAEFSFDASVLACGKSPARECPTPLKLWSPDDPKLYRVVVSGERDSIRMRLGFAQSRFRVERFC